MAEILTNGLHLFSHFVAYSCVCVDKLHTYKLLLNLTMLANFCRKKELDEFDWKIAAFYFL